MSRREARWYVHTSDGTKGPVSPHQLKQLALAGQISKSDKVRQGEEGIWMPASKVSGLFGDRMRVDRAHGAQYRNCPACYESIFLNAHVCKYCGSFLGEDEDGENAQGTS